MKHIKHHWLGMIWLLVLLACQQSADTTLPTMANTSAVPTSSQSTGTTTNNDTVAPSLATPTLAIINTQTPFPTYAGIPTPDPPRQFSVDIEQEVGYHQLESGESISYLAILYDTTIEELLALNDLEEDTLLQVGQVLTVPYRLEQTAPAFKIIPDSEITYGPRARGFDIEQAVLPYGSFLLTYGEEVEGQWLWGTEIVQLVANRYQVNPRLLLAVAEYQAGLVTRRSVDERSYLLNLDTGTLDGLYWQLAAAANLLNAGYYGWSERGWFMLTLEDESRLGINNTVNAGTVGVQNLFAKQIGVTLNSWLYDISEAGFFATYQHLFGNPFAYTVDPVLPATLQQPALRLPWLAGETWYFTGGPHGGYASGSPWAALDFVPGGDQLGCYDSDEQVVAMAGGVVTRSDFGAVVIDLDGDNYAGTGWAIHYLHISSRNRVPVGTTIKAGDFIGHPSCEGGFSNGTHIHISRTYNGRWLDSVGTHPFVLDGWQAQGLGREYDGLLVQGEESKEACECREELNALQAK